MQQLRLYPISCSKLSPTFESFLPYFSDDVKNWRRIKFSFIQGNGLDLHEMHFSRAPFPLAEACDDLCCLAVSLGFGGGWGWGGVGFGSVG